MPEKIRITVMKLTALTGVFLFIYPGVELLRYTVFKGASELRDIFFFALTVFFGYLTGRVVVRDKSKILERIISVPAVEFFLDKHATVLFMSKLTAYLTSLVPFFAVIIFSSGESLQRRLIEASIALIFYFIGLRANFREFGRILGSTFFYIAFIFSMCLLFAVTYSKGLSHLRIQFSIMFFIAVIASLIIQNQAYLDLMVMKKEAHSAGTPRNIRIFNIKAVVMFLFFLVLLLNLNSIVAFTLSMLKMFVSVVVEIMMKLFRLLFPDAGGAKIQTASAEVPFFGRIRLPSPFWNFITEVFRNAIFLYAIYKFIPAAILKIRNMLLWIIKLIKRLLFSNVESAAANLPVDYTDETETVGPPWLRKKKESTGKNIRKFRKALKDISDPIVKIRVIYACIAEIFIEKKIDIRKSDTTGEILKKAMHMEEIRDALSSVTSVYDKVRYGDVIPQETEVFSTEKSFERICGTIDRK
ncbi:MAG: hypothetical protein N3I35_03840 [Clostridia bacterium]|nr:hypothetical protein [Clostridia bacterium]